MQKLCACNHEFSCVSIVLPLPLPFGSMRKVFAVLNESKVSIFFFFCLCSDSHVRCSDGCLGVALWLLCKRDTQSCDICWEHADCIRWKNTPLILSSHTSRWPGLLQQMAFRVRIPEQRRRRCCCSSILLIIIIIILCIPLSALCLPEGRRHIIRIALMHFLQ